MTFAIVRTTTDIENVVTMVEKIPEVILPFAKLSISITSPLASAKLAIDQIT